MSVGLFSFRSLFYRLFSFLMYCLSLEHKLLPQKLCFCTCCLKGQCHEIFDFWFFSLISFPQASEYTSTAFSNFFENSQRYSWLKVHHRCQRHRWQMEKIFRQKNFHNFVWAPLGSRVTIYKNFCLQVHFKVSAAGENFPPVSLIPVANLPPVSLIPAAICHRCH